MQRPAKPKPANKSTGGLKFVDVKARTETEKSEVATRAQEEEAVMRQVIEKRKEFMSATGTDGLI